jgi:hypothetical protein
LYSLSRVDSAGANRLDFEESTNGAPHYRVSWFAAEDTSKAEITWRYTLLRVVEIPMDVALSLSPMGHDIGCNMSMLNASILSSMELVAQNQMWSVTAYTTHTTNDGQDFRYATTYLQQSSSNDNTPDNSNGNKRGRITLSHAISSRWSSYAWNASVGPNKIKVDITITDYPYVAPIGESMLAIVAAVYSKVCLPSSSLIDSALCRHQIMVVTLLMTLIIPLLCCMVDRMHVICPYPTMILMIHKQMVLLLVMVYRLLLMIGIIQFN